MGYLQFLTGGQAECVNGQPILQQEVPACQMRVVHIIGSFFIGVEPHMETVIY